jgi:hypothetical protein
MHVSVCCSVSNACSKQMFMKAWLVRFEVFLQWWGWWYCSSGFQRHVGSSVNANVSEKHTVSIFRAAVAMLGSGGFYIGLEEGKAGEVGQLPQYVSPKRWHLLTSLHGVETQKNSIIKVKAFIYGLGVHFWGGRKYEVDSANPKGRIMAGRATA